MKRILILLLTIILTKTIAFSENILTQTNQDSIVSVTVSDLKYANLIFVEHKKLLKDNLLLSEQINNLNNLNYQLTQIDSLRQQQVTEYKELNESNMDTYNKELQKKNKIIKGWQIGSITVGIGLILLLFLK